MTEKQSYLYSDPPKTMITEEKLKDFERQVANDKLQAFVDLLATFGKQRKVVDSLRKELDGFKKSLEKYAEESHYRVDWDKLTARPFQAVGDCMRCSKKNIGVLKYSDFQGGYMVCESCFDRLCDEFDDEYK